MLEQYDSSDFLTGWGGGGGQLGRVQSAPFDWPEAQKKLGNFTGTINLNYCLQADNQPPQHTEKAEFHGLLAGVVGVGEEGAALPWAP